MLTNNDLTKLKNIFVTKEELQLGLDNLDRKFDGKFNQVMNMLDAVMFELKAIREEQTIIFHRSSENGEK